MIAYLVDPDKETVTEVQHNGDWREINTLIGSQYFEAYSLYKNGDTVYVGDEAALHATPDSKYFIFHSPRCYPFLGKGLILGSFPDGESRNPQTSIDTIRKHVFFGKASPEIKSAIDKSKIKV